MIGETFLACGDAAGGFLKARHRSQSSGPNIIPLNVRLIRKEISQYSRSPERQDAIMDQIIGRWDTLGRVVFYVDPDPNSQLLLMRLLAQIHSTKADHRNLVLLHRGEPWGGADPENADVEMPSEVQVQLAHLEAAAIVWTAYRAPTPQAWPEVGSPWGQSLFPFLPAAVNALLDDLPRRDSGLGSSERRVMKRIGTEGATVREVLAALHLKQANFLDVLQIEALLQDLAAGPHPVVAASDGLNDNPLSLDQGTRHIKLTDLGLQILDGARDLIEAHGIDRWWGGTHLTGADCWRWDHEAKILLRPESRQVTNY